MASPEVKRQPTSLTDLPRWARRLRGKPAMPLPSDALQSAVLISGDGVLAGTGFVVRVPSEDGRSSHSYVITAHHVIRDLGDADIRVQAANPFGRQGEMYEPVGLNDWRQPFADVDLAVAPYDDPLGRALHGWWVHAIWTGHPDLGASIYYVGMFSPLNRPIARSGTVAAIEQEGIPHSDGAYDFPAHLVDCRSYDGFSGSPCLMEVSMARDYGKDVPDWVPKEDLPIAGLNHYTFLCGMFTAHYTDDRRGVISSYGVGVMMPGMYIVEALMTDEVRAERAEVEERRAHAARENEPTLRDASVSADDRAERVSLDGVDPEDALRALLRTPPHGQTQDPV